MLYILGAFFFFLVKQTWEIPTFILGQIIKLNMGDSILVKQRSDPETSSLKPMYIFKFVYS